jgi:hypothetical protein
VEEEFSEVELRLYGVLRSSSSQLQKIRSLRYALGLQGCQSTASRRLVSEREEGKGTCQPNPRPLT